MKRLSVDNDSYQAPQIGLYLLQIFVAGLFFLFVLRFWYLQIHHGEDFVIKAQENRLRQERIFASRGLIRDVDNVVLADNLPAFSLGLIREDCPDIAATLAQVSAWLHIPLEPLVKKFRNDRNTVQAFEPIWLYPDLSFEQMAQISSQLYLWPGLEIITNSQRTYPQGSDFAHILGYVAEANPEEIKKDPGLSLGDSLGKQGVELVLEQSLRGQKGLYQLEVDVRGRSLNKQMTIRPVNGQDIRLSLSAALHRGIVSLLGEQTASVVLIDPHTGRLHALVTTPAYDNNMFVAGLSHAQWIALRDNFRAPLQNRAIQSVYPPASTWKLLMAGLFLEKGINPKETVFCNGETRLGNQIFRCWKKGGHGNVNMEESLVQSCDIYFYLQADKLGIDNIAEFAKASGFGKTTGIDLPHEKAGLVPSSEWKKKRLGEPWYRGETYNISIGQGYTLVTPLQMATFVSALVNGGILYKPQIFMGEEVEAEGTLPLSEKNRQFILDAMVETVDTGTAKVLRREGIRIGGKTGTAQVVKLRMEGDRRLKSEEMEYFERDHAWMVATANFKGEDLVVVVMVEHGGGGSAVAGPIARDVMDLFFRLREGGPEFLKAQSEAVSFPSEATSLQRVEQ